MNEMIREICNGVLYKKKLNSMVHHFKDAERLGQIINGMKTNQIIEEEGQIPDKNRITRAR